MTSEPVIYEERAVLRDPPGPQNSDVTMVRLKEALLFEGIRLLKLFVDQLYPEDERGRRVPILHEVIDDEREEWLFLEEIFRRWRLWKAGVVQPDSETMRFDRNEEGVRGRLNELRAKYSEMARAAGRRAG